VHSTQSDALWLVVMLIKHRLCRVNVADVWSLFESTAMRPTAASLCLLVTVLDEYGAPEHGQNTARKTSSVRGRLLNWLLRCRTQLSDDEFVLRCRTQLSDDEFVPLPTTHLDAMLVSRVLVALTVRNAHVSHNGVCSAVHASAGHTVGGSSDIERLCLLSTFHADVQLPLCVSNAVAGGASKVSAAVSDSSVLHCRQNELLTLLSTDIDYSVASAKPEVRT